MIPVDLPDGPSGPLVRSLAACLSSVTEAPLLELPALPDVPVAHALGAWRSWLAGRGSGLVPVADPRSFAWAGFWVGVADGSGSPLADGPQRQVAVLAFGTPPGVVLSPQDPGLLGRATADLDLSSAWVVASLDPVLAPVPVPSSVHGTVELVAVAPGPGQPMQVVPFAQARAGRGLDGDRYASGTGTFSPRGGPRPGFDLTLITAEDVEELLPGDPAQAFARTRRNVLTRGVDVNALVGREFTVGDVRCRGLRLAEPCAHLERLHGPGLLRPLISHGGLRADVLSDGVVAAGSVLTA